MTKIHILTVACAVASATSPILSAQIPVGWERSQSVSPVESAGPPAPETPAAGKARKFVPDEILVGFKAGSGAAQQEGARNVVGAKKLKAFEKINVQHWKLPPGLTVERAIQILSANPNVKFAEPNHIIHANDFTLPNDPLRGELWGMHNLGQNNSTPDADIDALEAWQLSPGTGNVVVGVIDTGIDFTHPDLVSKKWINPGETPGNGADDDNNGYVDDVHGWDFVNNDNDPSDDNSHGTHVAGTIAANGNDGTGVIGVAGLNPNVQMVALKCFDVYGEGTDAAAISALDYAASLVDANGEPAVRITNNSWGGGGSSEAMKLAIEASNALFVAAAGNDSVNFPFYPAGYALPNVLAVAATNSLDSLAWFSNYGSWVHIAAPGESILSTTPGGNHERFDGTSMATPHVTGAAAMVLSQSQSGLSPAEVKQKLLESADVVSSLSGKTASGTRLNVARALGVTPDLDQDKDTVAPAAVTGLAADQPAQTSVRLTWTVPSEAANGYLCDVRYLINSPVTDANWNSATALDGEPAPVAGVTTSVPIGELAPGTVYYFGIKLLNRSGVPSALTSSSAPVRTLNLDWKAELVDTVGDLAGYRSSASLAFKALGVPVLAYSDYASSRMKVATRGSTGWVFETLGRDFGAPSLALDADKPNVAWSNGSVLNFSTKASGKWSTATVDRGNIYRYSAPSLAYTGGIPAISYRLHSSTGGLKYATRSGTTWKTLRVDAGPIGPDTSLAFNPKTGRPAIAYARYVNGNSAVNSLAIALFNGTQWDRVQLDGQYGISGEVTSCSLAFDSAGNPIIANCGNGVLRIHRWMGSAVYYATFDRAISCDLYMEGDHCWVAYDDGNGKRNVLNGSLAVSPSTWTREIAELDGSGSGKPSIRPASDTRTPHLGYFVGRDLRLTKRTAIP